MKPTKERRTRPRAEGTPGLVVDLEPIGSAVQVRDISLSGISFKADRPIEFMTRLVMTLEFPADPNLRDRSTPGSVQCEGAVVRCDPADNGNKDVYDIAVFFTQLSEQGKQVIEDYVRRHR